MAIPLALTTISVTRPDQVSDGYAPTKTAATPTAAAVRAAITGPSGVTVLTGGLRTEYTFVLNSDPCDVQAGDIVTDDTTGEAYTVGWVRFRPGLGIDHMNGRLKIVKGGI